MAWVAGDGADEGVSHARNASHSADTDTLTPDTTESTCPPVREDNRSHHPVSAPTIPAPPAEWLQQLICKAQNGPKPRSQAVDYVPGSRTSQRSGSSHHRVSGHTSRGSHTYSRTASHQSSCTQESMGTEGASVTVVDAKKSSTSPPHACAHVHVKHSVRHGAEGNPQVGVVLELGAAAATAARAALMQASSKAASMPAVAESRKSADCARSSGAPAGAAATFDPAVDAVQKSFNDGRASSSQDNTSTPAEAAAATKANSTDTKASSTHAALAQALALVESGRAAVASEVKPDLAKTKLLHDDTDAASIAAEDKVPTKSMLENERTAQDNVITASAAPAEENKDKVISSAAKSRQAAANAAPAPATAAANAAPAPATAAPPVKVDLSALLSAASKIAAQVTVPALRKPPGPYPRTISQQGSSEAAAPGDTAESSGRAAALSVPCSDKVPERSRSSSSSHLVPRQVPLASPARRGAAAPAAALPTFNVDAPAFRPVLPSNPIDSSPLANAPSSGSSNPDPARNNNRGQQHDAHSLPLAAAPKRRKTKAGPAKAAAPPAEAPPDCIACTSPLTHVAIGGCSHSVLCAECSVRMRVCHDRKFCVYCMATQPVVAVVPWSQAAAFDRRVLNDAGESASPPPLDGFFRDRNWVAGIYVSKACEPGLLTRLRRMTAVCCRVCDSHCLKPFKREFQLVDHVRAVHKQHMCEVCTSSGRFFIRELDVYRSEADLRHHLERVHRKCEFCDEFLFDADALFQHMHREHWQCHACHAAGIENRFFSSVNLLWAHMQEEHHVCNHPDCANALVAFPNEEELSAHTENAHRRGMPPIDRSRARILEMDAPEFRIDERGVRVLVQDYGGVYGLSRDRRAPPGGFVLIDDAEGTRQGAGPSIADQFPSLPLRPGAAPPNRAAAAARPRPAAPVSAQPFPSLADAVAEARGASRAAAQEDADAVQRPARPRPLVRREVSCPCGLKKANAVVEEGTEPRPLHCDSQCYARQRQLRLADAFDVDPEHRSTTAFILTVNVEWPLELVLQAKEDLPWLEQAEAKLLAFATDRTQKQLKLSGLTKGQSSLLEKLAPEYGIAPRPAKALLGSFSLDMVKGSNARQPAVPLSRHTALLTLEDIERLKAEAAGRNYLLMLHDVPDIRLVRKIFRQWEPQVEAGDEEGTALLHFAELKTLQGAVAQHGGGWKGKFLIDPSSPGLAILAATGESSHQRSPKASGHGSSRRAAGPSAAKGGAAESARTAGFALLAD